MNIAYISNSIIPSRYANSVQVMSMCHAFAQNGHHVTLFAKGPLFQDYKRKYGFTPEFKVVRSLGIKSSTFRRTLHKAIVKSMRPCPDLLFGRDLRLLTELCDSGIPIVLEAHDPPLKEQEIVMHRYLFTQKNFKRLVLISTGLLGEYRKIFPDLDMDKVLIAPNGSEVNSGPLTPLSAWPGRPGHLQLGYVGHLYPGKGMETILDLAARMPDEDFHVVGGWDADIQHWKAQCHSANVYFHGFVDHGKITAYLDKFDIVLAPFQKKIIVRNGKCDISAWTSPLKLLEYMAAGKTIVAANLPVLADILSNRENAILVEAEDIPGWIQAIEELKANPALRAALGKQAQLDIEEKLSWRIRARKVLDGLVI
jgi:glycosyltransferase involved in cell wall biosynthesis